MDAHERKSIPDGRRITSQREKAGFEPVPPDVDVDALIDATPNFQRLPRYDARAVCNAGSDEFAKLIEDQVIEQGIPLVVENWHTTGEKWPYWIFNLEWLKENHGHEPINVRDLNSKKDMQMTYAHYIKNLPKLAGKFSPEYYDGKQQRLYGKDLDCPPMWQSTLSKLVPRSTFYLDETADLMSSLPPAARAENMMCYVGHEGTYTPAHKEMCATLGQNIMIHASSGLDKDPGTSIWFMTCAADRSAIAEYWLSRMGHDIEVEAHFASIEDLQEAPFTVYVHEQKLGDYIIVPPLAPHQVWNRGEATVKAAWNRTTVDTLKLAVTESLPKARLVCRDEQYKCRAIIHETLRKHSWILVGAEGPGGLSLERMKKDFVQLFYLFNRLMLDECFSPDLSIPRVEKIDNEFNVQCSFCRGNIWNRFLTCKNCVLVVEDDEEDAYDICMDCYARGRSCYCVSQLEWVEQYDWAELVDEHERFRQIVLQCDPYLSGDSPKKLLPAFKSSKRKTLARVCQEQLAIRPWQDIHKNGLEEEEEGGEDSVVKKKRTGKSANCHVCKIRHDTWKCAECTTCGKAYCYGSLWRAFDMDPFDDILSKFVWQCPACRNICSCGACRKRDDQFPYEPKGTFLGASTKHVADQRSTEALVDFSQGNLRWIKEKDDGAEWSVLSSKRKRTLSGNSTSMNVPDVPVDPMLGQDVPNAFFSADTKAEGRFLQASIDGGEENSNSFASPQVSAATQAPMQEREAWKGLAEPGVAGTAVAAREQKEGPNFEFLAPTPTSVGPGAMLTNPLPTAQIPGDLMLDDYLNLYNSSTLNWPGDTNELSHDPRPPDAFGLDLMALPSLEQNPLAFMVATGLANVENPQPPIPLVSIAPSALSTQSARASDDAPSTQPCPSQFIPTNAPTAASPTLKPKPRFTIPRRSRFRSNFDFSSPTLPLDTENAGWVKKTKVANRRASNLRRKRSFIITLRLPKERLQALVHQLPDTDMVTSDLVQGAPNELGPTVRPLPPGPKYKSRNVSLTTSSPAKRRPIHPQKAKDPTPGESDLGVGKARSKAGDNDHEAAKRTEPHRQGAHLRRKQEEAHQALESRAHNSTPSTRGRRGQRETPTELLDTIHVNEPLTCLSPPEDNVFPANKPLEVEARRLGGMEAQETCERVHPETEVEVAYLSEEAAILKAKAERKDLRRQDRRERRRQELNRNAKLAAAGFISFDELEGFVTSADTTSSESETEDGFGSIPASDSLLHSAAPRPARKGTSIPADRLTPIGPHDIPRDWPHNLAVIIPPPPSSPSWRYIYTKPSLRSSLSLSPLRIHTRDHPRISGTVVPRQCRPDPSNHKITADSAAERREPRSRSNSDAQVQYMEPEVGEGEGEDTKKKKGEAGGKKRRVVIRKEVQLVPGRWAEVEVSEYEASEQSGGDERLKR